MIRFLSSKRFFAAYSGLLTGLFLFTVLTGFARVKSNSNFNEITVHRINVVEPDGTIRMVLTNKNDAPGAYIKNKEYPRPDRQAAGLLLFDDEGTEDGGLIYGLSKDESGHMTGSNVHLSLDQYMQDQIFTVDAGRDGDRKYSLLTMADRGDYSNLDGLQANDRIAKLPPDQRDAEWKKFADSHPGDNTRVVLGRAPDGGSVLRLKDMNGRNRIVLEVAPGGTPRLQLLDANGTVVRQLTQPASGSTGGP